MNAETFAYLIVLRREDGTTCRAEKPQWAHSAWSAYAQYLRLNPGAEVVSAIRMQQGQVVSRSGSMLQCTCSNDCGRGSCDE